MAVIIDDRYCFIHVAKTGGTFVRACITKSGIPFRETGPEEIHDHFGINDLDTENDFIYFGFVREPVSWLSSRHKFAVQSNFKDKFGTFQNVKRHWMAEVWSDNPRDFIQNTIDRRPSVVDEYFIRMLVDKSGRKSSIIFRYENLLSDIAKVLRQIRPGDYSELAEIEPRNKSLVLKDYDGLDHFKADLYANNPFTASFYL